MEGCSCCSVPALGASAGCGVAGGSQCSWQPASVTFSAGSVGNRQRTIWGLAVTNPTAGGWSGDGCCSCLVAAAAPARSVPSFALSVSICVHCPVCCSSVAAAPLRLLLRLHLLRASCPCFTSLACCGCLTLLPARTAVAAAVPAASCGGCSLSVCCPLLSLMAPSICCSLAFRRQQSFCCFFDFHLLGIQCIGERVRLSVIT